MIKEPIFLIGPGYRTDFAINRARLGHDIVVLMKESIRGAVEAAEIDPTDIDHIAAGNFAGEIYAKQGHLGALALEAYEDFKRNPDMQAAQYEAACASGTVAMGAGIEAILSGRSRVTLVEGSELMKPFATYVKRFSHWSLWRDKGSSEAFTSFAPG